MRTEIVVGDADIAAQVAARLLADELERHESPTIAVSGGRTPWAMLRLLADAHDRWNDTTVFQVDERVAPDGDERRNLSSISEILGATSATVVPMPVTDADLDAAADGYARRLPRHIDVVVLGMGSDGHTASLIPGDSVLEVIDDVVSLTGEYQGTRRMTFTHPVLERAGRLFWLVTGEEKRDALVSWRDGDGRTVASRVRNAHQTMITDIEARQARTEVRG